MGRNTKSLKGQDNLIHHPLQSLDKTKKTANKGKITPMPENEKYRGFPKYWAEWSKF